MFINAEEKIKISRGNKSVWLHFEHKGAKAAINLSNIAASKPNGIIRNVLAGFCNSIPYTNNPPTKCQKK
jgi:hypothetical protein